MHDSCCSRPRRAGAGLILWVVMALLALALLAAYVQSSSTQGAYAAVVRTSLARSLVIAGQSALEEAAFALQHPRSGLSSIHRAWVAGSSSGVAHDPVLSRQLWTPAADARGVPRVEVEPVRFQFAGGSAPPARATTFQVDLTVRTRFSAGRGMLRDFTRQVRRRYVGHVVEYTQMLGPRRGQVIGRFLVVAREPFLEVVEP